MQLEPALPLHAHQRAARDRAAVWPASAHALARAASILGDPDARCEPQANAALLGDKHLIFAPSGRAFISYATRGRSWLALGGPAGDPADFPATLAAFTESAWQAGGKPAIYGVSPSMSALTDAMGFRRIKTGERAILDLAAFSLDGKIRQVIRTHRNRHLKQGCAVRVGGPGSAGPVMGALARISDQWLARQSGGEKGFALGRFDPAYVDSLPLATVHLADGRIAAFATLWPSPGRDRIGVDLMRYAADAPNGVMDFLFAELFLWAKAEGYQAFDLNTAPAAGVEPCSSAPVLTTLTKLAFDHGEKFYNFQGVRRFKNKFHPAWEDVYLAVPRSVSPFKALARAALLINRP